LLSALTTASFLRRCRPSFIAFLVFFFTSTAPTELYTLSLHDALPICYDGASEITTGATYQWAKYTGGEWENITGETSSTLSVSGDRKSTRLNSSHVSISYAVFCLKKKKKQ